MTYAKKNLYLINFRLTQKHDGVYLAEVTASCLKRFGLDKLVCQRLFVLPLTGS